MSEIQSQADVLPLRRLLFGQPLQWVPLAAVVVLAAVVFTWMATAGTWTLFFQEPFTDYYDSLAASLWQLRLDVEPVAISGEGFIHNGKRYGYFGPTPAFPRMILNLVLPKMYAKWSRLMMVAVGLAHILLAAAILLRLGCSLKKPLAVLYLAGVGLGSTVLFLMARSYIYNEALIWSSALAMGAAYCAISYLLHPTDGYAWGAAICAVLSSWSRVTVGAAAVLLCFTLLHYSWQNYQAWKKHRSPEKPRRAKDKHPHKPVVPVQEMEFRKRRMILAGGMLFFFFSFVAMNYIRFGTFFDSMPIHKHVGYTPQRLADIGDHLFHPEFAPRLFVDLLSPASISFRESFPWIAFAKPTHWEPRPYGFDHAEPFAGVLATMPGLALLAFLGIVWGVRLFPEMKSWFREILVFLSLAFLPLLCFPTIAHRYLQDLIPFLAVAAAFGVKWFQSSGPTLPRRAGGVATALLLLWSLPANLSLTLIFQREEVWGVEESAKGRYREFQKKIDAYFQDQTGDKP